MKTPLPKILAVDFDGTLVSDKYPEIGSPNEKLFTICKRLRERGVRVILWTCRNNEPLAEAVMYCYLKGLSFDAVNENIPETQELYGGDTRKVFADVYLDDKALHPYKQLIDWEYELGVCFNGD